MTDWKAIRKEFEENDITMRALADKHNVKYSTLRSRKNREKWGRTVATDDATDKPGGQRNNNNAKGNPGNSNASPPPNNKNAVSHGLFANWLPEESLEIIKELSQKSPADMIWENILIQYTAIIRSQKIMYIMHQTDSSSELQGAKFEYTQGKDGNMIRIPTEESYNHQYAWDKQEKFLSAQSRAMGTLSNLIKQFVTLADEQDERRLKLEKMRQDINVSNAKLELMKDMLPGDEESTDDGFLAALEEQAEDLWPEE